MAYGRSWKCKLAVNDIIHAYFRIFNYIFITYLFVLLLLLLQQENNNFYYLGHNQKFISEGVLPSLPSLFFLSCFLYSPLFPCHEVASQVRLRIWGALLASSSGGERHYQPPDTFPEL